MRQPTEVEHALDLLREVSAEGWDGGVLFLEVDPTCGFAPEGSPRCGAPLATAVLLRSGEVGAGLVLCERHGRVMRFAVDIWRTRS